MDLISALTQQYMKPELPTMNVGDTVRVTVRIKEGNRERNQAFEGVLIAKKHGASTRPSPSAASPTASAAKRSSPCILPRSCLSTRSAAARFAVRSCIICVTA